MGADRVSAWDISESAVQCARADADAAGVVVDVRRGLLDRALARGPYDIVVSSPPYVPAAKGPLGKSIPDEAGPPWAYNAGEDGRRVLDPCHAMPDLLTPAGIFLVVHSEFSGIGETLRALRMRGLTAQIVASQRIPFGPVLTARAQWLHDTGRMTLGQRRERLVVIRADR